MTIMKRLTTVFTSCCMIAALGSLRTETARAADAEPCETVTLYFQSSVYDDYVSIPEELAQSYQIIPEGDFETVTYTSSDKDALKVSADGVVTPVSTTTTTILWGAGVTLDVTTCQEGTFYVTVKADDTELLYRFDLVEYGEYYCEQYINQWIDENITEDMSELDKVKKACEFVAGYDYAADKLIGGTAIILEKGGDCHASTQTINYMCNYMGLYAWSRNAANDPGAGSGHTNSIVKLSDDSLYIADSGFQGTAPRTYSVREAEGLCAQNGFLLELTDAETAGILQYYGNGGAIEIPAEIDGRSITAIKRGVFTANRTITSVVIPDSVTSIADHAFRECENLAEITVPQQLCDVGSYAFEDTAWLAAQPDGLVYIGNVMYMYKGKMPDGTRIVLKDGTTGIAGSAFYALQNGPNSYTIVDGYYQESRRETLGLCGIEMPDSLQFIGENAFDDCGQLESVVFGKGLKSVGSEAFHECTALRSVDLPESVEEIGSYAFWYCRSLRSVYFPENAVISGNYTLDSCSSLRTVYLPETLTSVNGRALGNCTSLTTLILPDAVTAIEPSAFINCTALTAVSMGKNIRKIDARAFEVCENLTDIYFAGTQEEWEAITIGEKNEALAKATVHFGKTLERVAGDVNADLQFSVLDIIAAQKWMMGDTAEIYDWKAADICTDSILNAFDLAALKKMLLNAA